MEADIIKCLIVEYHTFISILNELVDGKGGVVRLNYSVRDLGEGKIEKVSIIRSGYSSLIFDSNRVSIPDLMPPPKEWHT